MSARQQADDLAGKAAEAVRRVLADAEERAADIVRDAEAKAARVRERAETDAGQIRQRAESDARAQIEAAKRALDELGGTLAAAVSSALPQSDSESQEKNGEEEAPEKAESEPPAAPEAPTAPPVEAAAAGNGDDAAERLVAMKLAVDGKDSAEIDAELSEKFGARDRTALVEDVLSRVPR